jgi:hypothetical protein
MLVTPVLALALVALAAPATAAAAGELTVSPSSGRFGDSRRVEGRITDAAGTPLAAQPVSIEARLWPFTGAFAPVAAATTDAAGRFSARGLTPERNVDVRAVAADGTSTPVVRVWTYPAFTLRYRQIGRRRIRITQRYRTPRDVQLRAPTLFYLARASAKTGRVRARARTQRTAPGRFVAAATVRLPASWKGRFRYASCFRYTPHSGMGDPRRGCGRRFTF